MTSAAMWRKTTFPPWKINRIYSMRSFDIPEVKWVERYVVGTAHPKKQLTQKEINRQLDLVNRALRYGTLISLEQNFTIISSGNKDIVTQYTVYHVGFRNRPPGK